MSYNKNNQLPIQFQNGAKYETNPIIDTVKMFNDEPKIAKLEINMKRSLTNGPRFEKLRKEINDLEDLSSPYINNSHNNVNSNGNLDLSISSEIDEIPLNDNKDDSYQNSYTISVASNSGSQTTKVSRVSDLKKHQKVQNIKLSSIRNIDFDNDFADISQVSSSSTLPKNYRSGSSLQYNEDFEALLSTASSIPETDIDSGNHTPSMNCYIQKTHFFSSGPDRTKSLTDLANRADKDLNYCESPFMSMSNSLYRTKSEDLRNKESNLVNRLKSKAQSKTELRVAESLTKLNIPEWMDNFKYTNKPKSSLYDSMLSLKASQSTKDIYSSLRENRVTPRMSSLKSATLNNNSSRYSTLSNTPSKSTNSNFQLPSTIYRSKSQNLDLFNPETESKLFMKQKNNLFQMNSLKIGKIDLTKGKSTNDNNNNNNKEKETAFLSSSKSSDEIIIKKVEESKMLMSPIKKKIDNNKHEPIPIQKHEEPIPIQKHEPIPIQKHEEPIPIQKREESIHIQKHEEPVHFRKHDEPIQIQKHDESTLMKKHKEPVKVEGYGKMILQDKFENNYLIQLMINNNIEAIDINEKLCKAFSINYSTLRLLMNVKRKTPNLNRDTYCLKENRNDLSNKCRNEKCSEILNFQIPKSLCSCYNCFTYYCSKKCRNYNFTSHTISCNYERIEQILNRLKLSLNLEQKIALYEYSRDIFIRENKKGVILVSFESSRAADDFLNGQSNRLISQPIFLVLEDLKSLSFYNDYNYNEHFQVCFMICATLPMMDLKYAYPTFRLIEKYSKPDYNELPITIINNNNTAKKSNETASNVSKAVSDKSNERTEEMRRTNYVKYVLNYFRKRNMDLAITHPKVFKKLENYSYDGQSFQPMTVYFKDSLIKATVECLIAPEREIISRPVKTVPFGQSLTKNKRRSSVKVSEETEI